jgi:primosomal protein N' (replication factor Y)
VDETGLSDLERAVLAALRPGEKVSSRTLEKRIGQANLRYVLNRLERMGLVGQEQEFDSAGVQAATEKWISLKSEPQPGDLERMRKRSPRQARVLERLIELGGEIRRSELDMDASVLRRLQDAGRIEVWEEERLRDAYASMDIAVPGPVSLTPQQTGVVQRIREGMDTGRFSPFLLHGVTGSGKTQVYLESVRHCLEMNRTALVLIPEISLTPQAVQRYRGAFGGEVAVLHSAMSRGERFDAWRRIRAGRARIALGPRSAVFAPLERLGLIVVDEEHDGSYKQNDPAPRYHARDTALVRGRLNACTVVLGSATPSLESYANAKAGKYTLCELPERIDRIPMPSVEVVDMKTVPRLSGIPVFSPLLAKKIRERLANGEQAIVLQNRRGYAAYLRCRDCGQIDRCPHCEISLTFHRAERRMRCHYCGFQRPPTDACSSCGGATIQYRGVGTEKIEEEIRSLFPEARLVRMDTDALRKKGAHAKAVSDFEGRRGDILLGTQIVAKGHDFPGVTLVGVVSADTGLFFPDFRSAERTFQLLTQAAGRAGRKDRAGEVVIQTLSPDHPILRFTRTHAYLDFFEREIRERRELQYPPAGRIILRGFRGPQEDRVKKAAVQFAQGLNVGTGMDILGPAPAPINRLKNEYRYQVVIRAGKNSDPDGNLARDTVRKGLSKYMDASGHRNVRVKVDVDPQDMM